MYLFYVLFIIDYVLLFGLIIFYKIEIEKYKNIET